MTSLFYSRLQSMVAMLEGLKILFVQWFRRKQIVNNVICKLILKYITSNVSHWLKIIIIKYQTINGLINGDLYKSQYSLKIYFLLN